MSSQMNSPLVSVIMNSLNSGKYVRAAIDSVYAQTYTNWEIIFWDNASTDDSPQIAKSYDGRLRYFRSESTVPLGLARNKAMEQAKGEFIAFLDCDDLWLPEKLVKQIPLFKDPEVGLVFSDTLMFNQAGGIKNFYASQKYYTGHCFREMLINNFLDIESVVIRRKVLEGMEWFDPRFNLIEDWDFFCLISYRWKLAMVDEILAKWRCHSESWTWSKGDLVAGETEDMIKKFSGLLPGFTEQYQDEIAQMTTQIAITKAKHLWKQGNGKLARKQLSAHLLKARKALGLFVLSYFPEPSVRAIIGKARNQLLPS